MNATGLTIISLLAPAVISIGARVNNEYMYGDKTPEEAALKCHPDWEDHWCSDYDDEDK